MKKYFPLIALILLLLTSVAIYMVKNNRDMISLEKDSFKNEKNESYSVTSSDYRASEVGQKIIADGGNAADAAIGVAFALAIVEPYASGLGGGGALLYYDDQMDAPDEIKYQSISSSVYEKGDLIGVPGLVRGMDYLQKEYGSMKMEEILDYVIPLAEDGITVDARFAQNLALYKEYNDLDSPFYKNGEPVASGEKITQPELADTLQYIQAYGVDAFYEMLGESMAEEFERFNVEDFTNYTATKGDVLSMDYQGSTVYTPSSPLGGVFTLQALAIDEILREEDGASYNFIQSVSDARDIMMINRDIVSDMDGDRMQYLDRYYIENELYQLNDVESVEYEENINNNTTHFVVVDKEGRMISATNTLNRYFGSGKYSSLGFYLNNSLDNFSKDPMSPNFGEPNKTPRSYTSPTIIVNDDGYIGIGTPGGNMIPTVISQIIIQYFNNDMTLKSAINQGRLFKSNDQIYYEDFAQFELLGNIDELDSPIRKISSPNEFGNIQSVIYDRETKESHRYYDRNNR
uniref:gamma-glutamyltransferase n=1 Tax=Nosocomiicoccus ampullae TaxID=489910 RepID=UPI00082F8D5D|nr:gamma-glutamyltransferase [Nosocomiicoccus ampullae]